MAPDPDGRPAGPAVPLPLWLLVLITTSGTFGIHVFVPALPQAGASLQAPGTLMSLTVSLYVLGLALGQLFYGPISDSLGRRPVLLAGLTLYSLAGLGAALAPEAHWLVVARLLQAMGGCAGLALGRAMVRDVSPPREAASRLAVLNLAVSAGPAMAPLLGGFLAEELGWRAVLLFLSAMGAATTLLALRVLPETNRGGQGRSFAALAQDYRRLVASPAFLGYAIGGGCATTSWYAYLAALPFMVVDQLGPIREVGFIAILLMLGTSLGNILAARLLRRFSLSRLLPGASLLGVLGTLIFLAPMLAGHLSLAVIVAGPLVYMMGVGVTSPLALTKALGVNPGVIGSAAGLYGCLQMAVGAVCAALVGFGGDPALAAGSILTGATLLGLFCFAGALAWERRGRSA
ncbi:Bcr/CflA family efflux MFS transporter [Roseococcus sp. SYP-B2431]|uniref:multidrug effflux MFS transporter n=1 Tax=Roseococcus sp. SYP-B2431 TaxID=2496640 RepID=UPI00103B88A4|nr:multidrug effflux MFS transporter [Roseococcus sp. SYP-B2431]TCH99946.1 Bcr/CflA family efflux MFS transporter [Roseococcus sp. SYP-B2431]